MSRVDPSPGAPPRPDGDGRIRSLPPTPVSATSGCAVNGRVKERPMRRPPQPPPGSDGPAPADAAEAILRAVDGNADTVDLELPLDGSFLMLVRLTVADLAREAGLGAEQVAVVRDEVGQVFGDLCRSRNGTGSSRWHFEVLPGALRMVARPTADPSAIAVRSWAPVPDVA